MSGSEKEDLTWSGGAIDTGDVEKGVWRAVKRGRLETA
jgi:hypothetical protein